MKSLTVIAMLALSSRATAWDSYPYPLPFGQVMKSSRCLFAGTVQSAAVVVAKPNQVQGIAKVQVTSCIRGANCMQGAIVSFAFIAKTIEDRSLSVNFPIGEDMLIALKSSCVNKYKFESNLDRKPDAGFVCDNLPRSFSDTDSVFRCTDVMFNKKTEPMTFGDIRAMLQ